MPDSPSKPPKLKDRGVYRLPYLTTANETILVAVNSRGQRVAERHVPPGHDAHGEGADLAAYLDRVDPRPLIHLVRFG